MVIFCPNMGGILDNQWQAVEVLLLHDKKRRQVIYGNEAFPDFMPST